MAKPVLYGSDYSVYVRIVRLALQEKGVDYDLVPLDIFAEGGPPPWYLDHHPFGKIPAFEHEALRLYETSAITRYVDETFDGPSLQPPTSRRRAVMNQIIGIVDSYAYRTMVWEIYVETVSAPREGARSEKQRVQRAMRQADVCLSEVERLKFEGDWLIGGSISLADLYLAPVIAYFIQAPSASAMLTAYPEVSAWWGRIRQRPAFSSTEPTS